MTAQKEHLGDDVYASFDGHQIWIEVEYNGWVEEIALTPEVFMSLVRFEKSTHPQEDSTP